MPRFRLLAAAGVFALGLPSLAAFADDEVLVPTDDPAPSLPDQSGMDSPSLPTIDPDTTDAAINYTPLPSPTAAVPVAAPTFSNPTHVVTQPPANLESSATDNYFRNSLKINVAEKNVWGPTDLMSIQNALGISPSDAPKHCHLSIDGTIQSDDNGLYSFDTGLFGQAIAHYDGNAGSTRIRIRALCDMLPLPPNSGYVTQVGDKYSVFLYQTSCTPRAGTQNLIVQYNGNGSAKCSSI